MPHDSNGRDLAAGQTVTMTFRVTAVHRAALGESTCNVDLDAVEPPAVAGTAEPYLPRVTCNSRLVTVVE
jgi:hypothetical protein